MALASPNPSRVSVGGPAPGEELNPGAEIPPRASSSLILLRDGAGGAEVLLVRRNPEARFMGGAWVFPGGALDEQDESPAHTAVRELAEESGVALDGVSALVPFSRWITPAEVKVRFDTRFFVARAPQGAEAVPDGSECVAAGWFRPSAALEAHARDELELVFPTIKHLEELAGFATVESALETAGAREVVAIQPRVASGEDGDVRVLLPGDPGFTD
jgi:8-oxo-dGTP pyrophosphatase MutT (NUDIX family)